LATTIVMPQMGYDMQEGKVARWHKKEGDMVTRGTVIADIETDKATVEFEAYATGVLRKIIAVEGKAIPVGSIIAIITDADETLPADYLTIANQPASTLVPKSSSSPTDSQPTQESKKAVRVSPIARRLARDKGIELSLINGSGPAGRIIEKDVLDFESDSASGWPNVGDDVNLSRMRQAIAKVTTDSKRKTPHFYITSSVDMTQAMALRRECNSTLPTDQRISVNDLVIKACALALQHHPKFNSFFRDDHLYMNSGINIGIAIAMSAGLIVPGINACEDKSLLDIASASKDLIARANNGTLRNEEYSGTTFSISNLGAFDVDSFAAIIFPPHAAVLAVAAIKEQPVVREGAIVVAKMMMATLSVDHRVADGAEAAPFLVEVKKLLENPSRLLL
jgi:pyruvate dehydrogenase E2 component (dihydrolipoamide acetyltransferase)